MIRKLPRILIISSVDPTIGPGVNASLIYEALKRRGLEVDLMTKYKVKDRPEYISVFDTYERNNNIFKVLLSRCLSFLLHPKQKDNYFFFYKKETYPPVPIAKVLNKIKKEYDLVQVYFWQGLLSYKTISAIYNKIHCTFRFSCADYSPMTGGCHFPFECERYQLGCGKCPGINSNRRNDFTSFNVKYRQRVITKVHPIVDANTYMIDNFFNKSFLFKNYDCLKFTSSIVNLELYCPRDRFTLRHKFNIKSDIKYILCWGCQSLNDKRKGLSILIESLSLLYKQLPDADRESVLVLLVGKASKSVEALIPFNCLSLGFLPEPQLAQAYAVSDLFLSPSINDAGPMMLLQAIACGTPVVSFELGHAIDYVKNRNTGYCAKNFDSFDFADKILQFLSLSRTEQENMRENCRFVAETCFSEDAYVDNYLKTYYQSLD